MTGYRLPRIGALLVVAFLLSACSGGSAPVPKSAVVPTTAPAAPAAPAQSAPAAPAANPAAGAPVPAPAASPAAAAQPSGPLEVVNAAMTTNFNHIPAFVAVEKGIFLKYGIDLKLKQIDLGQNMAKALQVGEVQFVGAAVSNGPLSIESGISMVGVVGYMHDATNPRWDEMVTIVGRKDRGIEEGNIQSVMGKRIGTTAGGTGDQYIKTLFKQMSLPADKIELLPVVGANWQSSITTGTVDALVAWEPYITQILDQVPNLAVVKKGGGVVGYMTMFSTNQKLVQERPDLVKRFVTAFAEAQQYVRLHRDEAAEISTRWIAGLDLSTAKKAISYMPYDPRLTKYSMQNWDEAVQDLLDQKKIKRAIPASEAMNTTFIDQVQKEHPEFFTDLKPIP